MVKPEVKTLSAPTGKLQTPHLSINHMIEQQRENIHIAKSDLPKKPFDRDDLIRLWKMQAHTQKLNGQDQVHHIMTKRDLQHVEDYRYHFEVDGAMQKTRMDNAMDAIMTYLRQELQNFELEITIDVTTDQQEEETKFLTGNDRFEKMARKNSNLFDFKNRFSLDIEY